MKKNFLTYTIIASIGLSSLAHATPTITTDITDIEKEKILTLSSKVTKNSQKT